MARITLIGVFFLYITGITYSQSNSEELKTKSREHFKTQLSLMDSLWVFRSAEASPENETIPQKPDSAALMQELKELEKTIPLKYSPLVWDFVRFYAVDHHRQTERLLGLAENTLISLDSILEKENVPEELKHLPLVSAALNPHFTSEKGASGPWQLMYSTGRLYELSIDSYIDERRDPALSTKAAAGMIKDLHKIYQDWRLVLTAYTCGPSNLNRAIQRAGTHSDFNKIYNHLPNPERDIYPAYVAMIYLINHTQKFNISPDSVNWPVKADTVTVNKKLHLGQVADMLELDMQLLKDLNPVYRRSVIPASYQKFNLVLPTNSIDSFRLLKDTIYHHRDTFFFKLKPEPDISEGKTYASYKPNKPSGNHTAIYYTIKSGDNLGFISEWFDVSIRDLRYWNNIRGHMIRAGQRLLIYVPKDRADYYRQYDKLSHAEKERREGKRVKVEKKEVKKHEPLKPGEYTTYTVKKGDNPWTISQKYPGVSSEDILRWNNIRAKDLKPGQKLKIKKQ